MVPIYNTEHEEDNEAPPAYPQADGASNSTSAVVKVLPLPDTVNDGVIVRIEPPTLPQDTKLTHVPCDIVLVIDVSGSMSADAPVPGETEELTGLSVLDLVKHSCRTIMSTLDQSDRLAIVTFSNGSKVLQPLTAMTTAGKEKAEGRIEKMSTEACTNLWHGLRDGINLFKNENNTGRVPAVMVLTDGLPNHMCPPQGYVPALKALGHIVPSLHTFGFGYKLRSGLLKSIAEFGGGNYSFIPDAGMIGTVFVHAVANLQSTFATNASIRLTYPDHINLQQTCGASVDQQQPGHCDGSEVQLTIPLGNLQYGQSRDIYLRFDSKSKGEKTKSYISATLTYNQMTAKQTTSTAACSLLDISLDLSAADIAYHISRHQLCAFLAGLFPIDALGEHRSAIKTANAIITGAIVAKPTFEEKQQELNQLIASIPAAKFPDDDKCIALMQDLTGAQPHGQISLALSRRDYFERWGQHYLPSLHGAHIRQLCNSFKDPGPLQYAIDSPLFIKCRDELNKAFDDLPVPTPSNMPPEGRLPGLLGWVVNPPRDPIRFRGDAGDALRSSGMRYSKPVSMSVYNLRDNPCFAGRTRVQLANGETVQISSLQRGTAVATPMGPREVAALLVTPVKDAVMVKVQGALVTPWHPIALPGSSSGDDYKSRQWVFPCKVKPQRKSVTYSGQIYSVLLQRDNSVDAHAIMLSGRREGSLPFWGVTLGHGLRNGPDVRAHTFFGSYNRVLCSMVGLRTLGEGRFVSGGVTRSRRTKLVCGFRSDRLRQRARAPPTRL